MRQVLLNRMRSGAGQWHELADLVPALAKLGIDNTIIEAETGIERAQLNAWLVSVQVRSLFLPCVISLIVIQSLQSHKSNIRCP